MLLKLQLSAFLFSTSLLSLYYKTNQQQTLCSNSQMIGCTCGKPPQQKILGLPIGT